MIIFHDKAYSITNKGETIMQTPSIEKMASVQDGCELLRQAILEISKTLLSLKKHPDINLSAIENDPLLKLTDKAREQESEMKANIMLAYRHLEDARMRIGKVTQAYERGISIYDKQYTKIIINGRDLNIMLSKELTYEDIVSLSHHDSTNILSLTYAHGVNDEQGSLSPGDSIEIKDGMIFNVADTSNA